MDPKQHVVVIGAGPGLGAAIARAASARQARITVLARSAGTVDPLVAELAGQGADIEGRCVDAAHEPMLRSVLEAVVRERGAPTLLVYNAVDTTPVGPASGIEPEQLTMSLETNVTGALTSVQAVLEPMRAAGGGTVILTGGVLATKPWAQMSALSVGKAAIRTLAQCLHQELGADDPVHLVTVTVGGVIRAGGAFDPSAIAARMFEVHDTRELGEGGEITYAAARPARA